MVNLHFSLLPRWRGVAPVERALLAGDEETGVCLMQLEEGLDTGPVYARLVVPIGPEVDLTTLREELVTAGCALLVAALAHGVAGLPDPVPQSGEPTLAAKVTPEDLRLRWGTVDGAAAPRRPPRPGLDHVPWQTARRPQGHAGCRAEDGLPGAGPPGTLVGTVVCTGDGALSLDEVQPESRAPMPAGDWARGVRLLPGERLGSD